ncbi:hypothetical protein Pan14r_36550 [Crateriforma conspicua]|uniref:Uncharacterized protein n=1 Tax=Crateriforma conspicua TaxID=2527996 RepID=A0A5C5YAK4_9PLAN|nr:hypothetical protein Pan14r_36550 [Crateriforma conspicua]
MSSGNVGPMARRRRHTPTCGDGLPVWPDRFSIGPANADNLWLPSRRMMSATRDSHASMLPDRRWHEPPFAAGISVNAAGQ